MTNPNEVVPVSWTTDDGAGWDAYVGWNGLGLVVQAEIGGGAFILNDDTFGRLNTAILGPTAGDWVNIAAPLVQLEGTLGAATDDGVLTRFEAGVLTLTINDWDRTWDPFGNRFQGRADLGTRVRIYGASTTDIDYLMAHTAVDPDSELVRFFSGRITEWKRAGLAAEDPAVTLVLEDAVSLLQAYNGPVLTPVGAGDNVATRMQRILDTANSDIDLQVFDTDSVTFQATTLASPAWEQILITADAANRGVIIDGSGRLVTFSLDPTESGTALVFAFGPNDGPNDGDPGLFGPHMPIADVQYAYDTTQLRNQVGAARTGGSEMTASDFTSIARYGNGVPARYSRDDLPLQTDAQVRAWAEFVVANSSRPTPRITSITVIPQAWQTDDPHNATVLYPAGADYFLAGWNMLLQTMTSGYTVAKVLVPLGGVDYVTQDSDVITDQYVNVVGCSFTIDANWANVNLVTRALDSFLNHLTTDDAVLGRLDVNTLK